ncbi:MAG: guanine permease [Clostridiales bacterium GWF2_36_10]|nr:MAG: guanine permease [Clostridiales bacterium GWF2_36_10]HAN21521.1 guanine permease [Clostridiales bacterium]
MLENFFKLKQNGTKVSTEVVAGFTTFFAMAYIIFVNPLMLSQTGMPFGAVFLATIIAAAVGTLVMGLFANVPYAQAPGMGLNAFFVYTVCFGLGFSWQQALAMVFICGLVNILITVTKIRKSIVKSIPVSIQHAIGGGIGIFIAYIGIKNAGLLNFTSDPGHNILIPGGTVISDSSAVPALVQLDSPVLWLVLFGIAISLILVVCKVKGSILLGIIITTFVGIAMTFLGAEVGIDFESLVFTKDAFLAPFKELGTTFGAAFGSDGLGSLFNETKNILLVISTIFAFSLSDTFDTIGTFIGTGRKTGIFNAEDQKALESGSGFKSKMDKALFADSIATSVGAVFGTSNTTTYIESAAGIGVGGRTGLTSVVTAILFLASMAIAPFLGIVPGAATAPALIVVGIMMLSSFKEIDWADISEAIPAFFAGVFMAFSFSISYGIAFGFITYCLVKLCKKEEKDIHPILWISTVLFIINFVILALI